jgi:hypothetical protein
MQKRVCGDVLRKNYCLLSAKSASEIFQAIYEICLVRKLHSERPGALAENALRRISQYIPLRHGCTSKIRCCSQYSTELSTPTMTVVIVTSHCTLGSPDGALRDVPVVQHWLARVFEGPLGRLRFLEPQPARSQRRTQAPRV